MRVLANGFQINLFKYNLIHEDSAKIFFGTAKARSLDQTSEIGQL
jgi:hypothetical protein